MSAYRPHWNAEILYTVRSTPHTIAGVPTYCIGLYTTRHIHNIRGCLLDLPMAPAISLQDASRSIAPVGSARGQSTEGADNQQKRRHIEQDIDHRVAPP